MRKLLSANFARLWQSKVFWVLEAAIVGWGIFAYILFIYNTSKLGPDWVHPRASTYYYHSLMYIAAAMAIFCSQFFGTEYENGTLRNKLAVGHDRVNVYLSSQIVAITVGIIFSVSHILTSFIAVPFAGTATVTAVGHDLWRYLCWLLILGVYASLFTMLAMLDSNKSRNVLISLLLALVLIFAGIFVYGKVTEAEFVSRWVSNEAGQMILEENIENPGYLRGTLRTVFEWWDRAMPSSQGMHVMEGESVFDVAMPLCSVTMTALLTAVGIVLFKRKDLK